MELPQTAQQPAPAVSQPKPSAARAIMRIQVHPYLAFGVIILASLSVITATIIGGEGIVSGEPQPVTVHRANNKNAYSERDYYGISSASSTVVGSDPNLLNFDPESAAAEQEDIPVVIFPEYSQTPATIPPSAGTYGYAGSPTPLPDYVVQSLSISPSAPKKNQPVLISWVVKNTGNAAGAYPGFVIDYGANVPVTSRIVKTTCSENFSLAVNGSCTTQISAVYDEAGQDSLIVKANQSKKNYPESNYNNNWMQVKFTVGE